VIPSTTPSEALAVTKNKSIDLALLDYQMPEMNGAMLSASIKRASPKVKIILFSGCINIPAADLVCVDSFVDTYQPVTVRHKASSSC
jgi:CheY-like chemotaxis protein